MKEHIQMEYTKLGNTDIEISKICVDCMSFGKAGTMHDWTLDESATENVVKHALDLGINFFDTAIGYQNGTSEAYVGRALRGFARRGALDIEVYPAGDMTAPDYAAEIWVPVARIPDEG